MQLEALRHFVQLVNAGSFYRAARQSDISAQAFSKLLASLEKELGIALATRDRSGVHLTTDGETFMRFATEITARYDSLLVELYGHADEAANVTPLVVFSTPFCMSIASAVRFEYDAFGSDVRWRTESFDRMLERLEHPTDNELFFAEVFSDAARSELVKRNVVAIPYFQSTLGVIVHKQSSLSKTKKLRRSMLVSTALCTYSQKENTRRIEEVFGESTLPNIVFESPETDLLMAFLKDDPHRGFLTDSSIFQGMKHRHDVDTEELRFIPLATEKARAFGNALHSREYPPSAATLQLQSHIIQLTRSLEFGLTSE